MTPRTKEFSPPLEQQLLAVRELFFQEFNTEPVEVFVGPYKKGEQTFIHEGEVYLEIPEPKQQEAPPLEGYIFQTGESGR